MTDEEPQYPPRREVLSIFSGLMAGIFLAALDQTIVATALPTITGELGGVEYLSWVVTAYMLAATTTLPIYGKVSDLVGRKRMFTVAVTVFLAGSVLSGFSQTMLQLVGFRTLQGLGAGGVIIMAQAIIADVVPPRERGRYQGLIGAAFGMASVVGPLAGGYFVEHLTWRWVFYVNLPVGALALYLVHRYFHPTFTPRRARVDYVGAALLVAGVSAGLLITVWGGRDYGWASAPILGLAAFSLATLAVFVWWERRTPEPIIPFRVLKGRTFSVGIAISFLLGFCMFGTVVYMPVYLQVALGLSPTNSGFLLVPMMGGVLLSSIGSGQLISIFGRYKMYPIAGTALLTLAMTLFANLRPGTSPALVLGYLVLVGISIGLCMQVLIIAMQNVADRTNMGAITASANFFRQIGGSIGVAVCGAVLNHQLATLLASRLPAGALPPGTDPLSLYQSPAAMAQLPGPVLDVLRTVMAEGTGTVYGLLVPLAAVAFLLSWAFPELPLRGRTATPAPAAKDVAA